MLAYSFFVTGGSYLAVGVDSPSITNGPARVGRDQAVEVDHRLTALFEEGVFGTGASVRVPNNLAGVVNVPCSTIASESAQVLQL